MTFMRALDNALCWARLVLLRMGKMHTRCNNAHSGNKYKDAIDEVSGWRMK